jgi:hypothetical protein
LRDLQKGDKEKVAWLINEMVEISKILGAILTILEGKR